MSDEPTLVQPGLADRIAPLGFVEATAAEYHADELADQPTLSKSIIQVLLNQSPAHARYQHPKLNPDFARKEEAKFDLGNAFHRLFLEGIDAAAIAPFDDWRSAAAKQARAEAREQGRVPLLLKDYERIEEMAVAVRAHIASRDDGLFTAGKPEQTLTWEDRGVVCRARLDWFTNNKAEVHDIKTSKSANSEQWCRHHLFSIGADVQERFYCRGVEAVTGTKPEFTFLVAEIEPPYAVQAVRMGPDVQTLADKKIDYALDLWRRCLERDEWPAYSARVAYADLPPWEESRWLAREERELVGAPE